MVYLSLLEYNCWKTLDFSKSPSTSGEEAIEMTKDSILNMLQTLCMYSNVEIKHTFSLHDIPVITVRCLPSTQTIEVTIHPDHTVKQYEDMEEATEALYRFIQQYAWQ